MGRVALNNVASHSQFLVRVLVFNDSFYTTFYSLSLCSLLVNQIYRIAVEKDADAKVDV